MLCLTGPDESTIWTPCPWPANVRRFYIEQGTWPGAISRSQSRTHVLKHKFGVSSTQGLDNHLRMLNDFEERPVLKPLGGLLLSCLHIDKVQAASLAFNHVDPIATVSQPCIMQLFMQCCMQMTSGFGHICSPLFVLFVDLRGRIS